MTLSHLETTSAVWLKIKAWADEELARHRTQLEAEKTELQTAKLRGQIAALKELLRLEVMPVKTIVESTDHLFPR